jgi:hypothetical protein
MSVSLPKDITELELLSFEIVDVKATYREVLACDAQGRIYHCDLNYSQTLKTYSKEMQKVIGNAHQIKLGRSSHLFFQNSLSPPHCKVADCPEEMQTLLENVVTLSLCNDMGLKTYLDPGAFKDFKSLQAKLPINIIINEDEDPIFGVEIDIELPEGGTVKWRKGAAYDYKDVKLLNDEEGLIINPQGSFNKTLFKTTYEIDECNHSQIEVKVFP